MSFPRRRESSDSKNAYKKQASGCPINTLGHDKLFNLEFFSSLLVFKVGFCLKVKDGED